MLEASQNMWYICYFDGRHKKYSRRCTRSVNFCREHPTQKRLCWTTILSRAQHSVTRQRVSLTNQTLLRPQLNNPTKYFFIIFKYLFITSWNVVYNPHFNVKSMRITLFLNSSLCSMLNTKVTYYWLILQPFNGFITFRAV